MQASTRLDLNLIKNNFKEEQQKIGDRIGHAEGRLERMVAATSHENKTEVQEVRTALETSCIACVSYWLLVTMVFISAPRHR